MTSQARRDQTLRPAARGIGWITFVTGAFQVIAPGFVLQRIGGEQRAGSAHLFGTIGFFMVVVGGLLAQATARPDPERSVLTWAAIQKIGATTAMSLGVARGVFAPVALLVAVFDGVSAAVLLAYRARLRP
ncbi:MAG TPA: hypothetical protein VEP72_06745 [Microbacterium sp.]|nr:hypothetical protein [Microbacterium sp.]